MVERGGLENRCTLTRTVGSNPTPSASFFSNTLILLKNFFPHARDQRFYPRILPQQVLHWQFGSGKSWFRSETATTAPQSIQDIGLLTPKTWVRVP